MVGRPVRGPAELARRAGVRAVGLGVVVVVGVANVAFGVAVVVGLVGVGRAGAVVGGVGDGVTVGIGLAHQNREIPTAQVHDRQVGIGVAVELGNRDREREVADREIGRAREGSP